MKNTETNKSEAVFFIVGSSRSGTTLIARILKKNDTVHVLNETHFVEEFGHERTHFPRLHENDIYRLANRMLTIQRKDYYRKAEYEEYAEEAKTILDRFGQEKKNDFNTFINIFFKFEADRAGKSRVGDQTPRHVFYTRELSLFFPGAKFIHIIRDPRAVLLSQKRKWQSGFRRGQPAFEVIRTYLNYHPITTSIVWKKSVRAGLNASRLHQAGTVMTLFFERLANKPEKIVKMLCSFLDIQFSSDMLDVDVEMSSNRSVEGSRGISRSVSNQWIDHLNKTEIFLCEAYTRSTMRRLGYHPSDARPNLFVLAAYVAVLPLQLIAAFAFNIGRMGNPLIYITRRFFQ